jgi:hypothetical protein
MQSNPWASWNYEKRVIGVKLVELGFVIICNCKYGRDHHNHYHFLSGEKLNKYRVCVCLMCQT